MRVSVVTVCFNSAATIRYAIESFLRQTHGEREMLVIDGGSTDGTLDIVRSYGASDIRLISEPDDGIYDAMNKGLRKYSGEAIGFLNSDDAFHDEYALARIASGLENADIVYGDLRMIESQGSKRVIRHWRGGRYRCGAYQLGWMAPHPTLYVRRAVVNLVGDFDRSYAIASDYDFMLRAMALHKFRIHYIPHTLVDFQIGGLSTGGWRQTLQVNLDCLRARQRHLGSHFVDLAFFLRPLRRIVQLRGNPFS